MRNSTIRRKKNFLGRRKADNRSRFHAPRLSRVAGRELAVAGVAEAGNDVPALVEMTVERREMDLHVGMRLMQGANSFRSRDQPQEGDPWHVPALEYVDRLDGGAAGREHRVDDEAAIEPRACVEL